MRKYRAWWLVLAAGMLAAPLCCCFSTQPAAEVAAAEHACCHGHEAPAAPEHECLCALQKDHTLAEILAVPAPGLAGPATVPPATGTPLLSSFPSLAGVTPSPPPRPAPARLPIVLCALRC